MCIRDSGRVIRRRSVSDRRDGGRIYPRYEGRGSFLYPLRGKDVYKRQGMNLTDGDEVIGMQMQSQGDALMIVSEKGLGKCTLISEFTTQNRGGKGVKCYKITEKTGNIVGVKAVNQDNELMLITTRCV